MTDRESLAKRAAWSALRRIRRPERLAGLRDTFLRLSHELDGRRRQLEARARGPVRDGLPRQVLEESPPWMGATTTTHDLPAMIHPEEGDYYVWLGAAYTGQGAVLELGPWLGASTVHILDGLRSNPRFEGRRLVVHDDFVWRSEWMDPNLPDASKRPADGESFQALFEQYVGPYLDDMDVRRCRLATEPANASLPEFEWDEGPVEMAFVDCGRNMHVNEVWWSRLRPSFVSDLTLVVLQDWQTHKEVPRQWFNQMWSFTESKGSALELVHELREGGVATFLYRGG